MTYKDDFTTDKDRWCGDVAIFAGQEYRCCMEKDSPRHNKTQGMITHAGFAGDEDLATKNRPAAWSRYND